MPTLLYKLVKMRLTELICTSLSDDNEVHITIKKGLLEEANDQAVNAK